MPIIKKTNQVIHWTNHAKAKMRFYKLSEQRIKRVLNSPKRTEEGIAPNTVAMMQPASYKSDKFHKPFDAAHGKAYWTQEIWIMVQKKGQKLRIISAWRYPGMTKPGDPLPDEILKELERGIRAK